MDIKLPIALNTINGFLIYVADRIPSGAVLVCPFCRHPVKKNAGSIRRHHFVHMPGATCSVSYETLLHEGAKVFLHRCLEREEPVDIFIDTITLQRSKTRQMLESLGIRRFSISSKCVLKSNKGTHLLERVVAGKVKPDVVSYGEYCPGKERDVFAWEIFVTHEVEEDKAELLRANGIPYIELSPIEEGANSYIYTMKSHGGISFIDDDTIFNDTMYLDNKVDLMATFEKELSQEVLKTKLEEAKITWEAAAAKSTEQELGHRIVSQIEEITAKDAMALTQAALSSPVVILPTTNIPLENSAIDGRWVKVENVGCENFNGKYIVVLNERHYFSSCLGMLRGIYEELTKMGVLKGVAVKEKGRNEIILVGVKLSLPLVMRKEIIECSSILYKYMDYPKEEVIIWETRSKKSKTSGKYYMLVNDDIFVDSYEWQLKNILYHLLRFTMVEAHLTLNADKKHRVDALRISGLVQVEKLKGSVLAVMTRPCGGA